MSESMSRLPGYIFPSDRGEKTGEVLQQILTEIGSSPATLVFDAGSWDITEDITFPENVSLVFLRGASLTATDMSTITLDGCDLQAPPYPIFDGPGIVKSGTKDPVYPYKHPEWIVSSAPENDIGEGYLLPSAGYDSGNIPRYMATQAEVDDGKLEKVAISPATLRGTVLTPLQVPPHDSLQNVQPDQHRRIHISAGVPTGGQDGDIWIQYS